MLFHSPNACVMHNQIIGSVLVTAMDPVRNPASSTGQPLVVVVPRLLLLLLLLLLLHLHILL